jgi:citrate lyase subunit beta / citryl-CoA lyase
MIKPRRLRSLLFAPGNRLDLIEKLPRSSPDAVVIDLEDAVPASAKAEARELAQQGIKNLLATSPQCPIFLRLNAPSTPWFEDDINSLPSGLSGIVLPKAESAKHLEQAYQRLVKTGQDDLGIIAGIETARGVNNVRELHHPSMVAMYFGAEDFITDMGGVRTTAGLEVLYARSQVVLAARVQGVIALDIIEADFRNDEAFRQSATQGRALGYAGKMCIHPGQVQLANDIFSASPSEKERARALLEAQQKALQQNLGVFEFEGQMVDEPMIERARMILEDEDEPNTIR